MIQVLIQVLGMLRVFLGGEKATLLWDGLPAHRSRAMRVWLATQRSGLVVERLPAYTPELNLVEGLWSSLKTVELANLTGPTLAEVIAEAHPGIERVRHTPHLAYSFLRHAAAQGVAVLRTYLRLDPAEHTDMAAYPAEYGRLRADSAAGVVDQIRDLGGTAACMEADLADPTVPRRLFDHAEATLGPVEILVNNASGWLPNTFLPPSQDRFGRTLLPVDAQSHDRQFAVDARVSALLIAEFARRHLQRGASWGRVIGLTSGGPGGFPQEVSYGAAKAAQENYTMSAAQELGPYGVTANMVYPPVTDTGWVTPAVEQAATAASPLRHVAHPNDVAEVIILLGSHQARCITGQIIHMA